MRFIKTRREKTMADDDYDDDPWHGHNGSEMGPFLSPVDEAGEEARCAAYDKELEQMKKTLIVLHKKHAWRKFARDEEIAACNQRLAALGLPVLPSGYADFLKFCGGFKWDLWEFRGADMADEWRHDPWEEWGEPEDAALQYTNRGNDPGLYLGRRSGEFSGEFYVYNAAKKAYEVYSACDRCANAVRTYKTFAELFNTEVGTFLSESVSGKGEQ
jgi:hypothetical protein